MPSEPNPSAWKEKGNSCFSKGDFIGAIEAYQNGRQEIFHQIRRLEEMNASRELMQRHYEKTAPLLLIFHSNLAMTYIKAGDYNTAVEYCNRVLEQDPEHVKALYRRALALEKVTTQRTAIIQEEKPLSAEEKQEKLHKALDDVKKCIAILDSQPDNKAMKSNCKELFDRIQYILSKGIPDQESTHPKENDGKTMSSGLGQYLSMNFTLLPTDSPHLSMSSMKYEILAVKLMAAMEMTCEDRYDDGRVEQVSFAEEGKEILNKILTTVAQAPFCMFPANGSQDRCPPITVHLLAFYLRACLSEGALKKFGVEKFCQKVTEGFISEEEAFAIASHGYLEVEAQHSPMRGHAKSFGQSSQGVACLVPSDF